MVKQNIDAPNTTNRHTHARVRVQKLIRTRSEHNASIGSPFHVDLPLDRDVLLLQVQLGDALRRGVPLRRGSRGESDPGLGVMCHLENELC